MVPLRVPIDHPLFCWGAQGPICALRPFCVMLPKLPLSLELRLCRHWTSPLHHPCPKALWMEADMHTTLHRPCGAVEVILGRKQCGLLWDGMFRPPRASMAILGKASGPLAGACPFLSGVQWVPMDSTPSSAPRPTPLHCHSPLLTDPGLPVGTQRCSHHLTGQNNLSCNPSFRIMPKVSEWEPRENIYLFYPI